MNLQKEYDLEVTRQKEGDEIKKIKPYRPKKQKPPRRAELQI